MRIIIFLSFLLVLPNIALSAGFESEKECKVFADKIMDQFIMGNFQGGLDSAKPYWPMPVIEIDGLVNQIKQQWPVVNQRFGKSIAKEFIKEERIGKSFIRYYYLHKFENHSLYWQISYYKPHSEWKINQILYLDQLEPLYK